MGRKGGELLKGAWFKAFVKFPIAVANYRGKCTENAVRLQVLFCDAPANWIWNEERIFGEIVKFYSDEIKCPAAQYTEEMLAPKRTNNKQTFLQWQLNKLGKNWERWS